MANTSRALKRRLSFGPVTFMGSVSRRLWWDVHTPHGCLVVKAGFFKRPKMPRIYWSPNGTPWHHDARNVFRAKYVYREQCVCGEPNCPMPKFPDGHWTDR